MKLYTLRHCKRENSSLFFSPLIDEGLKNAENLKNKVPENIDLIFSSPFLRTLQTIYPYCKKHNKKVNIENALYEYCQKPDFNINSKKFSECEYKKLEKHHHLLNLFNKDYTSSHFLSNITFLENENDLQNRICPFIYKICHKYKNTNKNILMVTHMSVCNYIKKCFNKNIKINSNFEMGEFEIIEINNNWKGIIQIT